MSSYLIIVVFMAVILYGLSKKIDCYNLFIDGVKEGAKTTVNMFSYLLTFTIAISVIYSSGLIDYLCSLFDANYMILIIQSLIRPLSSSSSMSLMLSNYENYGVDSKISIISTLINYASDSSLYIIPFYCSMYKIKKYNKLICLGLIVNAFSYFLVIIFALLFL